jgi:hypothetical protein
MTQAAINPATSLGLQRASGAQRAKPAKADIQ